MTPEQRHSGTDATVLKNRDRIYKLAKEKRHQRCSGNAHGCSLPGSIILNPDKKGTLKGMKLKMSH